MLSAELAPQGIRVVGLRPQDIPETDTLKEAFEIRAKVSGMTSEQFQEVLASKTHARRLMTLAEMADVAAFMASDKASGMTGTTVNLTMGSLDDKRPSSLYNGEGGLPRGDRAPTQGRPYRFSPLGWLH